MLHRPSQALAYADAWSEGWDGLVLFAGIIVNVLAGVFLLRCAFRIRSVVPKLTFTWPQSGEEEVKVDTLLRGSVQGWFEGSSGETPWWFDAEGWRTEKARVANQGLSNWGAGREGFFTLGQDGAWRVTGPDGPILRSGSIEAGSVLLLRFHDGDPWTVFRSGEVRRMGEGTPAFHVQFPR